jgi:tetratricopeptide (TPR) repeat protein
MVPLYIYVLLYLAASLLASAFWKSALWGISSWGTVSLALGIAAAAVVVFLQFAGVPFRLFRRAPEAKEPNRLWFVAAAAIAVAAFWLLRARHDLWGGGHIIAASVENGTAVTPGAPLGMLLNRLFFMLVNSTFILGGATSTAILSVAAGAFYVITAMYAAEVLHADDDTSRGLVSISSIVMLANGFVVIFFGSGGTTPPAILFSLLFITSSLLVMRDKASIAAPAVLISLAVFSHLSALYLVPGFVYMIVLKLRSPGRRRYVWITALVLTACWAGVEAVVALFAGGAGPGRFILTHAARSLGNVRSTGIGGAAGGLGTAANAFLLCGPVTAAVLLALVPGKRAGGASTESNHAVRERRFLAVLAVSGIAVYAAGAATLYSGIRWEMFAATSPAFALLVLRTLRDRITEPPRFYRAARLLAVLGVFHTLPWLIVNVSPGAAERRLLSMPLTPGRAETILGSRSLEREMDKQAQKWFEQAVQKNERNDYAYYRLGKLEMAEDKYTDAITYLYKAHTLRPHSTMYAFALAEAYFERRWLPEAIDLLEILTETYPDTIRFWQRLGKARNHHRLHEEAIVAYERALALEPDDEQNVKNLLSAILNRGAQLQTGGDPDGARKHYLRAMRLYPYDWVAYNNLAALEMDLGNFEKAYKILKQAIKLHPLTANIALNMGLVLEKLGRDEEALGYLRRSVELDVLSTTNAQYHLQRFMQKIAAGDSTKSGG